MQFLLKRLMMSRLRIHQRRRPRQYQNRHHPRPQQPNNQQNWELTQQSDQPKKEHQSR
jgi:hypothetical protein